MDHRLVVDQKMEKLKGPSSVWTCRHDLGKINLERSDFIPAERSSL